MQKGTQMSEFKQTYITKMPDKAGSFLQASKIISRSGGNIVRVNYNKAVDAHTLFIEVNADEEQHREIAELLGIVGFLTEKESEQKTILIVLKLPDVVGAVTPVLEIINSYDINVSYISSQENGTPYQYFKIGLVVERASVVRSLLDDISKVCEVKTIDYDITEKALDNTVFYITFANEMRQILNLSQEKTNEVIISSNRIMQTLDERNEFPLKTFDYIKKFASFVATQRGAAFEPEIETVQLADDLTLYSIEPPCGSNTYIMKHGDELMFVDCGFACYKEEMNGVFGKLFGDLSHYKKSIAITHSDIDHTGLLDMFDRVFMTQSCYDNFLLEHSNQPNFREQIILHEPYCKLSKIISQYNPPSLEKCVVVGRKNDDELLSHVGELEFAGYTFQLYEGSGGHVKGETIFVCGELKLIFTGDIVVNPQGFSEKQRQFNILAPYLMTSVNVDSAKAKLLRETVLGKYKGYLLCPGHGAVIKPGI